MIKNYFKIAIRNIFKHKAYSFINITGLTIGIASCIIIFQYVVFEYSFDRFHKNSNVLYRVLTSYIRPGEEPGAGAFTGFALAPALDEAVPEIELITRLHPEYSAAIVSNSSSPERAFEEENIFYADPSFMKMFTFPLESGGGDDALQPGTVILSKPAAIKYFNNANPIGEVLNVTGQITKSYRVAGILKELPLNSHLKFDILLPMQDLLMGETYTNEPEGGWSWNNFITYIQIHPNADPSAVESKMTKTLLNFRGDQLKEQGYTIKVLAQPITGIHLNADIESPKAVMGNFKIVYFFFLVGLITLTIALVNYINLTTARSTNRAREVGMRKVVGAERKQLMFQFLCESAFTILLASVLAIVTVEALMPYVNKLAGTNLSGIPWSSMWFWIIFVFTFKVCVLLAGVYPGVVLSSFKPITSLKGRLGSLMSQLWLRRILVIVQFSASVILIGGTVIVYNQLNYMRSIDLGLDIDQVLTVNGPRVLPEGIEYETAMQTFTNELNSIPSIKKTAKSWSLPGQGFNWNGASIRKSIDDPANTIRGVATYVDSAFTTLYGMELIAGEGFNSITSPYSGDSTWLVMVNETAVKSLGIISPENAVGLMLDIGGHASRIIGVLKDFNWSSAHTERQNIVFGYTKGGGLLSLKIDGYNLSNSIKQIETIYNKLFPGNVFRYSFLNESFDEQYKNDERFATLFTVFAILAILIACLGLFGLADFTTRQRTKEIGIRKVLGASISEIVILLSRDFLTLVVTAIIIASPVTYYLMNKWLEGFAYRITIGVQIFLLTGAGVIIIAIATVCYQSIRTALANPIKSLRYE